MYRARTKPGSAGCAPGSSTTPGSRRRTGICHVSVLCKLIYFRTARAFLAPSYYHGTLTSSRGNFSFVLRWRPPRHNSANLNVDRCRPVSHRAPTLWDSPAFGDLSGISLGTPQSRSPVAHIHLFRLSPLFRTLCMRRPVQFPQVLQEFCVPPVRPSLPARFLPCPHPILTPFRLIVPVFRLRPP